MKGESGKYKITLVHIIFNLIFYWKKFIHMNTNHFWTLNAIVNIEFFSFFFSACLYSWPIASVYKTGEITFNSMIGNSFSDTFVCTDPNLIPEFLYPPPSLIFNAFFTFYESLVLKNSEPRQFIHNFISDYNLKKQTWSWFVIKKIWLLSGVSLWKERVVKVVISILG